MGQRQTLSIGQLLPRPTSNLSPCLKIGIILAVFKQSGKIPYFREKLNNAVHGTAKISAATFKKYAEILS